MIHNVSKLCCSEEAKKKENNPKQFFCSPLSSQVICLSLEQAPPKTWLEYDSKVILTLKSAKPECWHLLQTSLMGEN